MRGRVPKESTSHLHAFSGVLNEFLFLGFYMSLPGVEPAPPRLRGRCNNRFATKQDNECVFKVNYLMEPARPAHKF